MSADFFELDLSAARLMAGWKEADPNAFTWSSADESKACIFRIGPSSRRIEVSRPLTLRWDPWSPSESVRDLVEFLDNIRGQGHQLQFVLGREVRIEVPGHVEVIRSADFETWFGALLKLLGQK